MGSRHNRAHPWEKTADEGLQNRGVYSYIKHQHVYSVMLSIDMLMKLGSHVGACRIHICSCEMIAYIICIPFWFLKCYSVAFMVILGQLFDRYLQFVVF